MKLLTLLEAKYSMPLATWYENDTKSFCVSVFFALSSISDSYLKQNRNELHNYRNFKTIFQGRNVNAGYQRVIS